MERSEVVLLVVMGCSAWSSFMVTWSMAIRWQREAEERFERALARLQPAGQRR